MATTNLGLNQPANGSFVDTWNEPVNENSTWVDAAIGSVTTKSLTSVNVTLTTSESRVNVLRFTGTLTGNVQITLGAIIKTWTVDNQTLGNFVVTVTGGSGNIVGLPPGSCQITWDGTNVSFTNFKRVGEYWDHSSAAVPAWVTACTVPPALICDGSTFSAVTYPLLNKELGGNTLPDQRGRNRSALDGGTSRITTAGSGIDGATRFSAGGAQTVTLLTANLPPITPAGTNSAPTITVNNGTNIFTNVGGSLAVTGGGTITTTTITATASAPIFTGTVGGGTSTPVNKMPPTLIGGVTMIWAV